MSIFERKKSHDFSDSYDGESVLHTKFRSFPTYGSLFQTIPTSWGVPHDLTKRADALFNHLNDEYKLLFNTILWKYERFRTFCTCPSSLQGHHAKSHGNLIHTIQVAETFLGLADYYKAQNVQEGLLCALLHDAGKAVEYSKGSRSWMLTDAGKLLGHKLTLHKWIIEAKARLPELLPETTWLFLEHVLTASYGLPDYAGYRNSSTKIGLLLSIVDRLSGQQDIYSNMEVSSGWGSYHRHIKTTPFSLEAQ